MKLVMWSQHGIPKPPLKLRHKKVDELDKGLLRSLTGSERNPFEKRHFNLTAQLIVADQAPQFAEQLKFIADHPNPQPTTRCGMPLP